MDENSRDFFKHIEKRTNYVFGHCYSEKYRVASEHIYYGDYQEGAIVSVLKEFTEETGINATVEVTPWDNYWTILEAATTGGTLPDVFWMHSNQIIRYASNGILMDLTDRIAQDNAVDLSNFPSNLVEMYAYNNKQYGIPKDIDTIALWYNKKLFDEAGIAYPDSTWSWDNFKDAAQKLTGDGTYGYAASLQNQEVYWSFVFQNKGWIINDDWTRSGYDDPRTMEAIQFVVDLVREGNSPGPEFFAENTIYAAFASGVVGMMTTGSWMVPEMNKYDYAIENGGVAVLPTGRDGTRATVSNGLGWVANANTKQSEEAWKLLEFLSRESTQRKLSESGVAISAFNGTAEGWAASFPNIDLSAYTDQIPYGAPYPTSKNPLPWHRLADQLLLQAWTGARSVEDVSRDIAQQMNQMLADE
jgi:multiple sugar transport system substrate-binding protein